MSLTRLTILAFVLAWCASTAAAEDVQIWHWSTNEFALSPKFTAVLHGQLRTPRPLGEFLQARTGPIIRYYIAPKTSVAAGYYYRREPNRQSEGWGDSHRYFGGIEDYRFFDEAGILPASLLETRTLVEYLHGAPEGSLTNYTRIRHRNRFSFREWTVSPLFGYEIFFFKDALWGPRPHAGVRWRMNSKMMLDVAYMWDARQERAGARKHLIFTNLLIRFKRDPESDFPNRPPF